MDLPEPVNAHLSYSDSAPLLLAASSDRAMRLARSTADQSGFRIAAEVPIASAAERLGQQAALGNLWIEIDEDGGADLDSLLALAATESRDGRYAAVVSTNAAMLDPVVAALGDAPIEILVDADAPARAAALAVAVSSAGRPMRLSDVAADRSAEQLRQLSEEVNRIATMLARLSAGPDQSPRPVAQPDEGEAPAVSVETVRGVIRARRLRSRFFSEDLFADPAWDMLLDLLQAELSHLRVPVSSLCIAAAVPATTALRWLKTMVADGLFIRRSDPHDGRRVFVELAPDTRNALNRYFAEVDRVAAI
jgi:DNA-binding MarR family transcriptional regulator